MMIGGDFIGFYGDFTRIHMGFVRINWGFNLGISATKI